MQDKNVTFTKDGMRVGVKQLSEEDYAAKQQRYESLPFPRSIRTPFRYTLAISADLRIVCW